jgi:hypothetical protein
VDLGRELKRRGHKRLTDQRDHSAERDQLCDVLDEIRVIERELERICSDKEFVTSRTPKLLNLTFTLGKWLGERTTTFVDAALVAAARVAVARAIDQPPDLENAIEAMLTATMYCSVYLSIGIN